MNKTMRREVRHPVLEIFAAAGTIHASDIRFNKTSTSKKRRDEQMNERAATSITTTLKMYHFYRNLSVPS